MARPYDRDLRNRVIDAAEKLDGSARGAAARFGVGVATAIVWVRRSREGERTARRQGQPKGSKLDAYEDFLLGLVEARPDITLLEMAERLTLDQGVKAGKSTLSRFFLARGFSFKKNGARGRTRARRRSSSTPSMARIARRL